MTDGRALLHTPDGYPTSHQHPTTGKAAKDDDDPPQPPLITALRLMRAQRALDALIDAHLPPVIPAPATATTAASAASAASMAAAVPSGVGMLGCERGIMCLSMSSDACPFMRATLNYPPNHPTQIIDAAPPLLLPLLLAGAWLAYLSDNFKATAAATTTTTGGAVTVDVDAGEARLAAAIARVEGVVAWLLRVQEEEGGGIRGGGDDVALACWRAGLEQLHLVGLGFTWGLFAGFWIEHPFVKPHDPSSSRPRPHTGPPRAHPPRRRPPLGQH